MRKRQTPAEASIAFILCLSLILGLNDPPIVNADNSAEAVTVPRETSPVSRTLDEYLQAVPIGRRLMSEQPDEYRRWMAEWLDKLTGVALTDPATKDAQSSLGHAIGLSNALGQYETSITIAEALLSARPDQAWQARWSTELGGIHTLAYRRDGGAEQLVAAVTAYGRANLHLRALCGDASSTTAGARTGHAEQLVINLSTMGGLLREQRTTATEAAEAYREARELLGEHGLKADGRLTGYDAEHCSEGELTAAVHAGDLPRAISVLKTLHAPSQRWPASHYALEYARRAYPQDRRQARSFLSKWLANEPRDDGTVVLMCELAGSYFADREFEEARPLYEELQQQHGTSLLQRDEQAILAQRGGLYSTVLCNLGIIRFQSEEFEHALPVLDEFVTLYPRDDRHPMVTEMVERCRVELEQQSMVRREFSGETSEGRAARFRTIALLNLVLLGSAAAAYLVWRRGAKSS
jgi:tetratricopeptide (TPR) repeat protein